MQKWLISFAAVVFVANVSFAQANAKATVEAAIKATGGKEKLTKYPATKYKFGGEMTLMGMNVELEGVATATPGKVLTTMTMSVGGNKVEASQYADANSAKIKLKVGGMSINQPLDDAQTNEMKISASMYEISSLLPLLDEKKFELKAGEDAEVEKKKCDVVIATMVSHKKDVKLFFDKESKMLVKMSHEGLNPGRQDGKTGIRDTVYSDFKESNGIKYPAKMVNYVDGELFMTLTVNDYKSLEKIEDKEFNLDD
jgi:hypothetical protein